MVMEQDRSDRAREQGVDRAEALVVEGWEETGPAPARVVSVCARRVEPSSLTVLGLRVMNKRVRGAAPGWRGRRACLSR